MHDQKVLACPEHIKPHRHNKETICIDVLIADTIQHLWSKKIVTLGCCQGNINDGGTDHPSVIVGSHYSPSEISIIRNLIADVDCRPWVILQWQKQLRDVLVDTRHSAPQEKCSSCGKRIEINRRPHTLCRLCATIDEL